VAREAGVSVETVYGAFGNKATLLHRAWDITVGGDEQEVVFHERPEVMAIRNEPNLAKRLMLHAAFSTETARRIAPFQLMVQSAAGADPAAAAMLEEMGVETGLKSNEVIRAAHEIGARLGIAVDSHRGTGCTREDVMRAGAENPKHPQVTA
jgi:AcrR family transcriptional regulator